MLGWSRALVVVGVLVASCGGRTADGGDLGFSGVPLCTPGEQVACACTNGSIGAQRCSADGSFDACSCVAGGSGGKSGTGVSGVTGGSAGRNGGTVGSSGGGAAGQSSGGSGGQSGASGGASPDGRRLPLPCTAPLPTGYCLVSDPDDFIGDGKSSQASGAAAVQTSSFTSGDLVELSLQNASTGDYWTADFAPLKGQPLVPGLYDPATRYPFQLDTVAGLSIYGNGSGCNELTGKFAVEELQRDPTQGLQRFSVTFEQHCEGGPAALHGVINLNATGTPDPTPTPSTSINLGGKIFRVVYDPAQNLAYGLDATNRRLAKINLTSGSTTYADVVQVPNDACMDTKRQRLFVVNKGSSLITEYDTQDLSRVRDIAWTGTDWGADATQFKIYCTPDTVYVVDGAWAPALFSIDGLDDPNPVVTDHSAQVNGVGGLVMNQAGTDLYYWYQYGWSAGALNTGVHRLKTADLSQVDVTGDVGDYTRDPLDAPILLDEDRSLIFSKNKIFDATNLSRLVYSLPSTFDTFDGAAENAYALDSAHGRLATKNYVYELDRYSIVTSTVVADADQLFFDASGALWFLSVSKGALVQQVIAP